MVALKGGGVTEDGVTAPGDTKVAGAVTALEINQQNQRPLPPKITTEQPHPARIGRPSRHPKAIPDATYSGMWRVRWPDGRISDLANISRVNDAVAQYMERTP